MQSHRPTELRAGPGKGGLRACLPATASAHTGRTLSGAAENSFSCFPKPMTSALSMPLLFPGYGGRRDCLHRGRGGAALEGAGLRHSRGPWHGFCSEPERPDGRSASRKHPRRNPKSSPSEALYLDFIPGLGGLSWGQIMKGLHFLLRPGRPVGNQAPLLGAQGPSLLNLKQILPLTELACPAGRGDSWVWGGWGASGIALTSGSFLCQRCGSEPVAPPPRASPLARNSRRSARVKADRVSRGLLCFGVKSWRFSPSSFPGAREALGLCGLHEGGSLAGPGGTPRVCSLGPARAAVVGLGRQGWSARGGSHGGGGRGEPQAAWPD